MQTSSTFSLTIQCCQGAGQICPPLIKSGVWLRRNEIGLTLFQGGLHTSYSGGAILHTHTNFWITGDTELKFDMVITIHKSFPIIEKN